MERALDFSLVVEWKGPLYGPGSGMGNDLGSSPYSPSGGMERALVWPWCWNGKGSW